MDSVITNKEYDFPVEKRQLFVPKQDKYGNISYNEALVEDKNKVMGVVRRDTDVLLGVCSDKYKIISHAVVKDYADNLIKEIGYTVSSASMKLPAHGATMLYYSILDNHVYKIGNERIKATIECKNSYNGQENAGINVVFINENNSIYGFGFKKEAKLNNSAFVKHHGDADTKVTTQFGTLIEVIPKTIQMTVSLWMKWADEHVEGKFVKLICRAINAGFAKHCKELGYFDNGCSRFDFYSTFCKYNYNIGTIGKLYKSQKLQVSKWNNLFIMDQMYSDFAFAQKIVAKMAKFEYDENGDPAVKRVSSSRTMNALKTNKVDNEFVFSDPVKVKVKTEQIKEPPKEKEIPLVEPVLYEVTDNNTAEPEEEDTNKLLAGW